MIIDNYERFCKAFSMGGEDKQDAELALFVQNWIIDVLNRMNEDTLDYSLKKLMDQHNDRKDSFKENSKDALSEIIDGAKSAFMHLSENMREKIVRENIRMPVYKVREISSYGLNWLSRQPGKTLKEKVASSGYSIMAVQRRSSLDTAENRLFTAFAKELYEYLNLKTEVNALKRDDEEEFMQNLLSYIRLPETEEIKRWDNLPPNNTLLSDENYKKIWHAWNELKKLDGRISNNYEKLSKRLTTIFFVELLSCLKDTLFIPQEPVEVDYDAYKIYTSDKIIRCIDKSGQTASICLNNNSIVITRFNNKMRISFENKKLIFDEGKKGHKEYNLTAENFYECVLMAAERIGANSINLVKSDFKRIPQKSREVIVDLFSLHPGYIADGGEYEILQDRVLQQKYSGKDIDGDLRTYYIPCDTANAIKINPDIAETYTIPSAVDNGSMDQMTMLMHMMENYIMTDNFIYVFPDAYNELQLSMVHKAARMVYRKARNIPLSIGAAFKYQDSEDFEGRFNCGVYILVVNLIEDEVTFTLVLGSYDEKLSENFPKYKGVIWERHPTSTAHFKSLVDNIFIDRLTKLGCAYPETLYKLFGLEGIKEESDKLSLMFDDTWFMLSDKAKGAADGFRIDITDALTNFISRNRAFIGKSSIHIISVVDNLTYKGTLPYSVMTKRDVLEGCRQLISLENSTSLPLWHDYLPALSIKLLYGKFDLIKNARVEPKFDEKQKIIIPRTFTLPKNCNEYHLNLVQDENARKMQYEAVIRNSAFPLREDVECELVMTYQYGAEDPYELKFKPKNPEKAGFEEAMVSWARVKKYDISKLKTPNFPSKIPWEELSHYSDEKGPPINVLEELRDVFNLVKDGYFTLNVSDFKDEFRYENHGSFDCEKDGETIRVAWSENSWDENADFSDNISKISFWLSPIKNTKKRRRYYIPDLRKAQTSSDLWFVNRRGSYQCVVNFEYNGDMEEITLIENNFDMPERFHEGINNVSFEVKLNDNGYLIGLNIHDEDGPEAPKVYLACNICPDDDIPDPPRLFINSYISKCMRLLCANNRSFSEGECPTDLQTAFTLAVSQWTNLYHLYKSNDSKSKIFGLLSLAAADIGEKYYDIAHEFLRNSHGKNASVPYDIGCAFCDLSNDMQKELLNDVIETIEDDSEVICILARALWHNEKFVFNADPDTLLNKYLPKAVDCIGDVLRGKSAKKDFNVARKIIKYCLEYILGILRLRSLNDKNITEKYLSLNNPKMQQLYKYLEQMADNNIRLLSFLKLDITSKGKDDKICDLLYALLVYVTGYSAEGEIKISLNLEEDQA